MDDLTRTALALVSGRKTCDNCWHHDGGDCRLSSCDCATAVLRRDDNPPRWMSYEEGMEVDRKLRRLHRD